MASSSGPTESIEDFYAKLALGDESQGGLEYNEAVVQTENNDMQWCLVGKFLTEKPINFMYMKNTMTGLWRSVRGMCIKDLDQNLFLFQFYHHEQGN